MLRPNEMYMWEMETDKGSVLKQFDDDGKENSWKTLDVERIVRVSLVPRISILPQHNVIINREAGELFVKRFARGFIKMNANNIISGSNQEYANCIVTNRYRLWVFSNGSCLVTDRNYEVYI